MVSDILYAILILKPARRHNDILLGFRGQWYWFKNYFRRPRRCLSVNKTNTQRSKWEANESAGVHPKPAADATQAIAGQTWSVPVVTFDFWFFSFNWKWMNLLRLRIWNFCRERSRFSKKKTLCSLMQRRRLRHQYPAPKPIVNKETSMLPVDTRCVTVDRNSEPHWLWELLR